ncbi:MAG: nucleoside kinase [Bacteroidales bacterium]|nr:nucleoside kinase [Bacteroidales bacterium]
MRKIRIFCRNTQSWVEVPKGSTLEEVYAQLGLNLPYGTTNCLVNNRSEGLHYTLNDSRDVEFLDITDDSGLRTYTRSLFFVLYKAVNNHFPGARLRIGTPLSGGYFCSLDIEGGVTPQVVENLKAEMQRLIDADLAFHRVSCHTTDAIELFRQQGLTPKVKLLESIGDLYTHYYTLQENEETPLCDFFYGSLLLRTGQLRLFDIIPFGDGLLLRVPDQKNPGQLRPMRRQGMMFDVFREEHRWQDILGVSTVGELNRAILSDHTNDIVAVSEALQEKKISRIADHIAAHPHIKVVLIAGPSSSGKTTFAKRLCVQLMACGKIPYQISLDNYFVDRVLSPRDEKGDYDFEHIEAVNLELFNRHMEQLLAGEEIELPFYDFTIGRNVPSGKHLKLQDEMVLVLEGNHALNPRMSEKVPAEAKYKIYASALTTIMLDDHNYIPTTDCRLLRRICRDYKYRGFAPQEVIRRCPSVTAGEERWIIPFQEEADVMINTSLLYELAALRAQALPLLGMVPESAAEYATATRLRKFLNYFVPMPLEAIPPTSLLREFMGHSSFKY